MDNCDLIYFVQIFSNRLLSAVTTNNLTCEYYLIYIDSILVVVNSFLHDYNKVFNTFNY